MLNKNLIVQGSKGVQTPKYVHDHSMLVLMCKEAAHIMGVIAQNTKRQENLLHAHVNSVRTALKLHSSHMKFQDPYQSIKQFTVVFPWELYMGIPGQPNWADRAEDSTHT